MNKKILVPIIIVVMAFFSIFIYAHSQRHETYGNLNIEVGKQVPQVSEYIVDPDLGGKYITDVSSIETDFPSTYRIKYTIDGKKYNSKLNIVDTVKPKGVAVDQEIWLGDEVKLTPDLFV